MINYYYYYYYASRSYDNLLDESQKFGIYNLLAKYYNAQYFSSSECSHPT